MFDIAQAHEIFTLGISSHQIYISTKDSRGKLCILLLFIRFIPRVRLNQLEVIAYLLVGSKSEYEEIDRKSTFQRSLITKQEIENRKVLSPVGVSQGKEEQGNRGTNHNLQGYPYEGRAI
jgi:hypothetical protein